MARKKKGKAKATLAANLGSESHKAPVSLKLNAQCQDLCRDCQQVYITGLRGLEFKWSNGEWGVYVSELSHVREDSSCRLCCFFFQMRPWLSSPSEIHLHAFSARGIYSEAVDSTVRNKDSTPGRYGGVPLFNTSLKLFTDQDAIFFAVVATSERIRTAEILRNPMSKGLIAQHRPETIAKCSCRELGRWETQKCQHFYQSRIVADRIDYRLLQGWLLSCKKLCGDTASSLDLSVPVNLIDTTTREVVLQVGRNCRFVALSYVWGTAQEQDHVILEEGSVKKLPKQCSATIEDAIVVTRELGYQYLWVDMFCIDLDPTTKHNQIGRMDTIYECADVTIIAAAGKDAKHGLPGVTEARKACQPGITIGNSMFFSTLPHPPEVLKRSVWNTRGWTYQEKLFSRRCLVFTDDQVYLECRTGCIYESLSQPHTHYNSDSAMSHRKDEYLKLHPTQFEPQSMYNVDGSQYSDHHDSFRKPSILRTLESHIKQYTSRHLTYEEDSLSALKSILDRFPNQHYKIEHLWGVPFQPKPHLMYGFYAEPPAVQTVLQSSFDFAYGLCWTHGAKNSTSNRREAFPSWSWAGWVGPVSWLIPHTTTGSFMKVGYEKTTFTYKGSDGKVKPVRKWHVHQNETPPRFLNVKAAIFQLQFQKSKSFHRDANETLWDELLEIDNLLSQKEYLLDEVADGLSKQTRRLRNDFKRVDDEPEEPAPGAFYLRSYTEAAAPLGTSRSWKQEEAARLHLTRTSAEGQDWEQRLLTESWPAIILGQDTKVAYWLVLGRIHPKDDFYERIGVIQIPPQGSYSLEFLEQGDEFRLG